MSRTPIVLVHGLMGSLDDPSIRARLSSRPVIAPSLLGYGELSATPPARLSIAAQVAHLHRVVTEHASAGPVHVLGHSMGGVIAPLFAAAHPELVATIIDVEGNFTLKDAFWSGRLARMTEAEVEEMLARQRADPAAWLARLGIAADERTLASAREWLHLQPASTLRAMGVALVDTTSKPDYLESVRKVFATHPVHLVAGERSRDAWDTPEWAVAQAKSVTVMPGRGHLMMLEDPEGFGRVVASLVE
jgi:pimeloyl-ACP methyl ester carboxylesterase